MTARRLIPSWTRVHACRTRLDERCEDCNEPITHGLYQREVFISEHTRFGDIFIIIRRHVHPACPRFQEWE